MAAYFSSLFADETIFKVSVTFCDSDGLHGENVPQLCETTTLVLKTK